MSWKRVLALVLIACLAMAIVVADAVLKHKTWTEPARTMAASAEGLVRGAPDQGRPGPGELFLDPDGYYWVSFARQMVEDGTLRIRHTPLDNAPYGREVHWSSSLSWVLVACGYVQSLFSNASVADSLVAAALWCNPLLLVVTLVVMILILGRRMDPFALGALVLAMVCSPLVKRDFRYARPDHHGLFLFLALGMVICAVIACSKGTRRWFVLSGIFGGAALWIQAPVAMAMVAAVGLGLVPTWAQDPGDASNRRAWGLAGAATSVIFYLIEYFPSHMGMHLEVNHPLYAVGWLGGAELIAQVARWRTAGRLEGEAACLGEVARCAPRRRVPSRGSVQGFSAGLLLVAAVALVACALLPLAILFGPEAWFVMKNPVMVRIHHCIKEFIPLVTLVRTTDGVGAIGMFGVFPLFLILAGWGVVAARRAGRNELTASLLTALLPAVFTLVLTLRFSRFAGLHMISLIGLASAVFLAWQEMYLGFHARLLRLGLAVLIALTSLAELIPQFQFAREILQGRQLHPNLAHHIILRDLATAMGQVLPDMVPKDASVVDGRAGPLDPPEADQPPTGNAARAAPAPYPVHSGNPSTVTLLSGFETPYYQHFGGMRGTGSLYWENAEGLFDTVEFFADYDDTTARKIATRRGVDYVVVQLNPSLITDWHYCKYGTRDRAGIEKTLAYRLAVGQRVPAWLKALPPPPLPPQSPVRVVIYRVSP